jgi:hypothetical protein
METDKNKNCEYCARGNYDMLWHVMGRQRISRCQLPLFCYRTILLLVQVRPTRGRYSSVPRLVTSTWKGVAGLQPAVYLSRSIVCCLQFGDVYCKNRNLFSDSLLGKCFLVLNLFEPNCDLLTKFSGKQRMNDLQRPGWQPCYRLRKTARRT